MVYKRLGFFLAMGAIVSGLLSIREIWPAIFAAIPNTGSLSGTVEVPQPFQAAQVHVLNLDQNILGLDLKGNKQPEELSGGEQQRVGVALTLANDPGVNLADEPTGNLDTRNAEIIAKLLCFLAIDYGKIVIVVSHGPKNVAHFPLEYAMRDGKFSSTARQRPEVAPAS
jgi:ABC-type lipoprotein export system ATPase subunit